MRGIMTEGKRGAMLWTFALTVVCAAALLYYVDFSAVFDALKQTDFFYLCVFFVFYSLTYAVRCFRLSDLAGDRILGRARLWSAVSIGGFLNLLIPARLGDLSLVFFLVRFCGAEVGKGLCLWGAARFFDLVFLVVMFDALLLGYLMKNIVGAPLWAVTVALNCALLGLLSAFFLYIKKEKLSNSKIVCGLVSKFPRKLSNVFLSVDAFVFEVADLSRAKRIRIILYSAMIPVLQFVAYWASFKAANMMDVSFFEASLAAYGAIATQILPINTIAGIGVYQAGWVAGFSMLGFDAARAFDFSVLFHIYIMVCSGLLALSGWLLRLLK